MPDPAIRPATLGDAEAIAAIYAFHVLHGTGTFDTHPPEAGHWRDRIAGIENRGWPFLVAEWDGVICGYAYVAQFRDRPAYARTCENSVYVADSMRGRGVGRALLGDLIEGARGCCFEQMVAVIGGGEPASVGLHEALGFEHAGRLHNVGFKFERRLDTVYMQRDMTI